MAESEGDNSIPPPPLSGRTVNSFAYKTIKDRLPVILTKVLDDLCRKRKQLIEELGDDAGEDVTVITGAISKLKYELQTDKPITTFKDDDVDVVAWNAAIAVESLRSQSGGKAKWFSSPWLFAECYMYRRVRSAFVSTCLLSTLDPFIDSKKRALESCRQSAIKLLKHVRNVIRWAKGETKPNESSPHPQNMSLTDLKNFTRQLFLLCLWGNKCDLSISAGDDNNALGGGQQNPLDRLRDWDDKLLVDDFDGIWRLLMTSNGRGNTDFIARGIEVDWVVDNAGFEFLTDMILAYFLKEMNFVREIRFHVKRIPWFVSDVTAADVHATVDWFATLAPPLPTDIQELLKMEETDETFIAHFASGIKIDLDLGSRMRSRWNVEEHQFWTLPHAFRSGVGRGRDGQRYDAAEQDDKGRGGMRVVAPDLYAELHSSDLVIFKGDLNYRKLVGDLDWNRTTPFDVALDDFRPTNILALRTLKADTVVGLPEGVPKKLDEECPDWMTNGEYAVMQLCMERST